MKPKELKEVSNGLRNTFKSAQDRIKQGNTDYAIVILLNIIKSDPCFMEARKFLRAQEKMKSENLGAIGKIIGQIKATLKVGKGKTKIGKAAKEAMNLAEEALSFNLNNPIALNLLADAAIALKAGFIAIEALEILRDYQPSNEANLRKMSDVYIKYEDTEKNLETWKKISSMHPEDLEIQAKVREAAALASMQRNQMESGKSTVEKTAEENKDKDVTDQQGDKIVRSTEDIKEHIEGYEKKNAEGDESIENHRKLADLYMRAERYDDAIKTYQWIADKMGTLDPAIDSAIEKATLLIWEKEIKASNDESVINELKQKQIDLRLERAKDRVRLYPNDTMLRFRLAEIYFEINEIDNSLEQFQVAKRNPSKRLEALIFLGRCFSAQGQHELSKEQFETSIGEMKIMDKAKMAALYYFGICSETSGDIETAKSCYKDIYGANIKYRDVSERMKSLQG